MLKIGSVIDGKYKVLSEIGHGGMSVVYLAINEKANKPWAIKEVRKNGVKDFEIVRQSLLVETDLLKKLSHPNLPSIVDIIDYDDNFLIVMDYIEGNTLEHILKEQGAQKQEDVVDWAIQLCDVLDYLHNCKPPIIYRDMKPSNIMLKSDGQVVLIDFGTAREFKKANVADTTCLGTQGYAAPEQFGGMGQTDARTDIYCLGATMYHLVTGHNPSEPPYEMYPIRKWNQNLSSGLESIILKCTQKNPDDRYQSAGELMYALKHYLELDTSALKRYRRNIGIFGVTAGLAVLCMAGSGSFYAAAKTKQQDTYQIALNKADKTTEPHEAMNLYIDAIKINNRNPEAYEGFYQLITQDGVFDDEEEELLLRLNASTDDYLQDFADKSPLEYAQFCYDIGNAYWFYYIHEESRQSNAAAWFQSALEIFADQPDYEQEYKRCLLYVEIGNFYKKIVSAQIEGTDSGMYGEYWNKLAELKRMNDADSDRELITLRLYREIVTRSMEYSKYLCEDGISKEEILDMYSEIEESMDKMQENAGSAVKDEAENIRQIMKGAVNMINSSYR